MKSSEAAKSAKAVRKPTARAVVKKPKKVIRKPVAKDAGKQKPTTLDRRKTVTLTQLESLFSGKLAPSKKQLMQSNKDFGALVKRLTAAEIKRIGTSTGLFDLVYHCVEPNWCIPKLELLLRAGLDPDTPGLLHSAVYGGGPALRTLLRYGANPIVPDGKPCPFVAAADEGASDYQSQMYMEWLHEALLDRWLETKHITSAEYKSQWNNAMKRILESWKEEGQPAAWTKRRMKTFKEIQKQRFVYNSIHENAYTYEGQLDAA